MLNRYNLNGKRALITGGAGLLGVKHAEALIEIGAEVILTDISKDIMAQAIEEICNNNPDALINHRYMDVTDIESIQIINEEFQDLGGINILINNAAIDPKVVNNANLINSSRIENFSLDEWENQINVGLTGTFLCSKIFGTTMAERKDGVILNISSDLSVISPDQRLYRKEDIDESNQPVKPVTYSVIKTGLIGLTRYLATYWAKDGVRVNALSPGGVYNNQDGEFVARLSSLIPLGRMAEINEYMGAIQFLCSEASSYLTGQNIVMDGGRSVL